VTSLLVGMRSGTLKQIRESSEFSFYQRTRFLEVNRMISEMSPPEPIDFGVDIGGAEAPTLYVLDVTPAQWDAIQKSELSLPRGWTLEGIQELAHRRRS
jgi:hypothetical protein